MDIGSFGELLAVLRKQHHISQNELATKLDVHRNTVGNWERGTYLPESKALVLELAKHLHLNAQETRQLLDASLTETSPHWLMPYQRNPFFIGRDNILQQLHHTLTHERCAVLSQSYALSGLGGIGKTQTAIEYAYRYVNDYTAVFWINAETNGSIFSSFSAIADLLNLLEKQDKEQSRVIAAVTRWLIGHSDWLVIFDNVEDLELVKSILPPARCGSLLFTSRRQALGFTTQSLNLEQMTLEEGMRFLLLRARLLDTTVSLDQFAAEDVALAKEIVVEMDGLPLALDQAGAYIEATRCSLSDYLRLFQSSQVRLLDERETHADHPLSVSRTFSLAFERLEQNNPAAAELLTVCAFLAPDAIPEMFFIEGAAHLGPTFEAMKTDPLQFNVAIKTLLTYSLIQRNSALQTLTVHRLVQVVLKERLSEAKKRIWVGCITESLIQAFPINEQTQSDYWRICECLLPHALVCISLHELWGENKLFCLTLMNRAGTYLSNRAQYIEASVLFEQVQHIGEQVLDKEHPLVGDALYGLAMISRMQGKYAEAELMYQRVLYIRKQTLGSDHSQYAESLNMLGILYLQQGKYGQAEPLFRRVLRIWEQSLGSGHSRLASPLNNLGLLYYDQGKYGQAEPLFRRALQIREQTLGSDHPQLAPPLNNLAEIYSDQDKYEQAESFYRRALRIWEQTLGLDHPLGTYPLTGLADLYRKQEQYEQAESLYQRVLCTQEQALGPDHPRLARALTGLACLYRELGMFEQAELLLKRALNVIEKTLSLGHSDIAYPITELANLYVQQGKYEQAEPLFQRALTIRQQILGSYHFLLAETLHDFARFYETQHRTREALSLYQQVVVIREQALGYNHPKTQETRKHYVTLLQAQDWHNRVALVEEAQLEQGVDEPANYQIYRP